MQKRQEEDLLSDAMLEEQYSSNLPEEAPVATAAFVKESFEKFLELHEEILSSKEALIAKLEEENSFLKENLLFIQKAYSEDRELIGLLKKEIITLQEELEFTKRKYKMMWNKAIENYAKKE